MSAWTSKAVEYLIVEAAETAMLLPREHGPRAFGNSMPATLRGWDAYGQEPSRYIRRPAPGAIDRMMLALEAINRLPENDRHLLHAWAWQKARRGKFMSDFAAREGIKSRTLRWQISQLCQKLADDFAQRGVACMDDAVDDVAENEPEVASFRVSSPNRARPDPVTNVYGAMAPDGRPRYPNAEEIEDLRTKLDKLARKRRRNGRAH